MQYRSIQQWFDMIMFYVLYHTQTNRNSKVIASVTVTGEFLKSHRLIYRSNLDLKPPTYRVTHEREGV